MRGQRPNAHTSIPSAVSTLSRAVAMLGLAAAAHHAVAQTEQIYVDSSAPAGGNGTSWQQAYTSLTAACNAINVRTIDHDLEVRVAQGTYRAAARTSSAFSITPVVTNSGITISILGAFAGLRGLIPDARDYIATPTILSSDVNGDDGPNLTNRTDNAGSVLQVGELNRPHAPGAVIDGFTLRGGFSNVTWHGGAMTIEGANGASGVIIRQCVMLDNWAYSRGGAIVIDYGLASVEIDHCSITDNGAGADTGGLMSRGSHLFLHDSLIARNQSGAIGGLYLYGYQPRGWTNVMERCTIADNIGVSFLGGAYVHSTGPDDVRISDCQFTGNHAPNSSGAIQMSGGTAADCTFTNNSGMDGGAVSGSGSFIHCVFRGNHAASNGGAINGALVVQRCTFAENSATIGGAIYRDNNSSPVQIENDLFIANTAQQAGGAMHLTGGGATNCTFVGNSAPSGGAIDSTGTPALVDCIFTGNTATLHGANISCGTAGATVRNVLLSGGLGTVYAGTLGHVTSSNLIDANPRFADPASGDYHVLPGSPCIDRGDATVIAAGATDLDGLPRILSASPGAPALPDLGCYEFQRRNCAADTSGDGGVGIEDLLAFLDDFNAGNLRADFAGMPTTNFPDGGVTIDDLLFYLSRYNAGC